MRAFKPILTVVLSVLAIAALAKQLESYLDMPVAHLTYPHKKCVKVDSPDNDVTCEDLKDGRKYQVIYVSPDKYNKG